MTTDRPEWATTDFAVVDEESATKPGDQYTVLARFNTEDEAVAFLDTQDPEKVARGGFGIDGPTEDW